MLRGALTARLDAIDQVNVLNGQNSGYYFRYDVDTRFV